MATATAPERKNFGKPDETQTLARGKVDVVNIGGGTVRRGTFEPGWKWSEHVKPTAGTEWCETPHFEYQVSGRMARRDG